MLKYTDYDIVFSEIPDEVTLAINLSNCPHRCKNCHSPQLQTNIGEILDEKLIDDIILKYISSITCVCFMGGDSTPDDVFSLARYVKEKYRLKTGWYSGNKSLQKEEYKQGFDYIKLGAYQPKYGGLDSKTTNQHLYRVDNLNFVDITYRMWESDNI